MDDDAGRLGAGRDARVVAGIGGDCVADEQYVLEALLRRFDGDFCPAGSRRGRRLGQHAGRLARRQVVLLLLLQVVLLELVQMAVGAAAAREDLQSLVPSVMRRRLGHVLGDARQTDITSAADVHFRRSVDVGLRHCVSTGDKQFRSLLFLFRHEGESDSQTTTHQYTGRLMNYSPPVLVLSMQ